MDHFGWFDIAQMVNTFTVCDDDRRSDVMGYCFIRLIFPMEY